MSLFLHEIFGFGVSHDREKSANFYSSSYNLGNYETSYGILCIGGGVNPSNESSLCIELTATGLNAAKDGWEQRLYNFSQMKEVHGFRYTRVDLWVGKKSEMTASIRCARQIADLFVDFSGADHHLKES